MAAQDPDRIPVIVGVGELIDRPADPLEGLEPASLMAQALRLADADAGGGLIGAIGSLDIVNQMGWRYADIGVVVTGLLGIEPARTVHGPVGGESPVRYLNDAALRIARGESVVSAICGGEAQYSIYKARAAKISLPWTALGPKVDMSHLWNFMNPQALRHKVMIPAHIYPFYESATQAAWGQSPAEAQAESGALWAKFAAVAAQQPNAWSKTAWSAEEIATPSPDNRLIAWPYTKRMVANPAVNMGAAVIVTSLAKARALGIGEDRLIFIQGGAAANEPRDYLQRDGYDNSSAQDVVLDAARAMAGADGFGPMELYSCFPTVPKMARRTLGLGPDVEPTVTGGLSFFGAPINSYMLHAAVAMTRRLREEGDKPGLLYGQGEYVTKHHAVVVSRAPGPADMLLSGYDRQQEADTRRGAVPEVIDSYQGKARLEASTVIFDRDGEPDFGVVIARTPDGARLMARVTSDDRAVIARLMAPDASPVGLEGTVREGADSLLHWAA